MEPTADMLLAHERLVRAVASALLRDEHAVHDVVQDTWMRALRHGPRALAALPGWLRRTAANRALDVRRAVRRRRHHEERRAWRDEGEPVEVTVQRLAMQREVVSAMLALHQPYRTVVLLRYYHDLTPTAIASRLHTKPATVRTQLVRAHELLRERLDRSCGGRDGWAGLCAPWLAARSASSAFAVGCCLVAATGVACGGVWLLAGDAGVASTAAPTEAVAPPRDASDTSASSPTRVGRLAAGQPRLVRVQTAAGEPATDLPVWFWSATQRPLWTQPAQPQRAGSDHDTQLLSELGRLLPADTGPCASTTDGDGAIVLPEPQPSAMTMQVADCVWWTVELPVESPVELPPLASFRGRVRGLPAGATWDLELGSAPDEGTMGEYRVNVTTRSGRGVAFAGRMQRRGLASEDFVTNVLAMHAIHVDVTGHGVVLENLERALSVPTTVEWPVVAVLPTLTVRVREFDGSLTQRRGGVVVAGNREGDERWLQGGSCVFDTRDFGPQPLVRVRMEDGESVLHQADLTGAGQQRVVDVVLDGAIPPLRVHLPDLSQHTVVDVVVQHGGNNFLGLRHDPAMVRACVGMHAGALWIAEIGKRWEASSPIVWERLAIATEQGALALVDRPATDGDELWGAWEPSAPRRDIDVGAFCARLPGVLPTVVSLDCELRAIPSPRRRWGTGEETMWFSVRSQWWNPGEGHRPPAPVWRGMTLATGVRWRLRFAGRDGEELGVFDLTR